MNVAPLYSDNSLIPPLNSWFSGVVRPSRKPDHHGTGDGGLKYDPCQQRLRHAQPRKLVKQHRYLLHPKECVGSTFSKTVPISLKRPVSRHTLVN